MPLPRFRFTFAALLASGLTTGVALANAQANLSPTRRATRPATRSAPKKKMCVRGTPSKDKCLEPGYLDDCPKHKKACRPAIEDGFNKFAASSEYRSAPTEKMLRPNKTAMPKQLRDGKHFGYTLKGKQPRRGSKKGLIAASNLTGPATTLTVMKAKDAHRSPRWEKNGARARTCTEYAYEQVYDWGRFTDAAAVCRDDWRCQIQVALLSSTPGIADRTLKRKDGRPLLKQFTNVKKGKRPKNYFFVVGKYADKFVYARGPKQSASDPHQLPHSPDLDALAKTLKDGATHYKYGCGRRGCGSTEFKNEWDFHAKLYDRNKTLSMAEFEEYDRRKREFKRLLDEWQAEVEREMDDLKPKVRLVKQFETPFEWVVDPYDDLRGFNQQQQLVSKSKSALSKKAGKLLVIPQKNAIPQQHGALDFDLGPGTPDLDTVPVSVMAAPKPVKPSASKPTPRPTGPALAAVDNCEAFGNKRTKTEYMGYGPYSCRLGRFIRKEWRRIKKGQYSCLDTNSDDCDWSPKIFQDRWVEGVPYLAQQQEYLTECEDWMPAKFDLTLKQVEAEIAATKKKSEAAWRELEPYAKKDPATKKVTSLGHTWKESDAWGDKGFLAVGYSANLGWSVKPAAHKGDDVCRLAGAANAGFGTHAWVLGKKVNMVGSDVAAALNEGDAGKLAVTGNLRVLGKSIYKGGHDSGALVYDPSDGKGFGWQLPPGYKPQWTVMAGPVPITGAAWGEIMFGANFDVRGKLGGNTCNPDAITFGMNAGTGPFFAISAFGQVGVGIGGVASAGVRGMVNLITFGFPVGVDLDVTMEKVSQLMRPHLGFGIGMDMLMSTLSGKLMLYVEIMMVESTFELFRWAGLKTEIPLMKPLKTQLPLVSWKD